MAQKEAIYQVDNGAGFDEIFFKTLAKMVQLSNGKSIQEFFDNGGEIGGTLTQPAGTAPMRGKPVSVGSVKTWMREVLVNTDGYPTYFLFLSEGESITSETNRMGIRMSKTNGAASGSLGPYLNNTMELGTSGRRWKNVWVDSYGGDNNNGYTKLTNGYLMQWGQITVPANSESTITYPLYYSSPTYPIITPIGNRANGYSSVTGFGTNWAKIYNGSNISMTFKVNAIGK